MCIFRVVSVLVCVTNTLFYIQELRVTEVGVLVLWWWGADSLIGVSLLGVVSGV